MTPRSGLRIAIVGSGVSGLGAAWYLRGQHDVTLFEGRDRPGGHVHTHTVAAPEGSLQVDSGFIVFNRETYPLLSTLFDELEMATQPTNMSFSVECLCCDVCWSGLGATGLFAEARNAVRPGFLRFLKGVARLHGAGRRVSDPGLLARTPTLDDFVSAEAGPDVGRHYVFPLTAALWSMGTGTARRFPSRTFVDFFQRHRLFQVRGRLRWETVSGGSGTYVDALLARAGARVVTGSAVRGIARGLDGIRLRFDERRHESFDRVILATHADQALALLDDPTDVERELLGAWRYTESETWLHSDGSHLPRPRRARASWNYRLDDCRGSHTLPTMTYNLNRLQRLPTEHPFLVTLNPDRPPERAHSRFIYRHPVYTEESVATQMEISRLNGKRRTYFAGAYLGFGFHEDGLRSAAEAAADLGAAAA